MVHIATFVDFYSGRASIGRRINIITFELVSETRLPHGSGGNIIFIQFIVRLHVSTIIINCVRTRCG